MKFLTIRQTSAAAALFCLSLLGVGAYLQFYQGLQPCPLCIIQRLIFLLLGILFFLGSLYQPQPVPRRVYYSSLVFLCVLGFGVALHQVSLQHLPPEMRPACGADLEVLFENLPVWEAIKRMFQGTGECAIVDWTLLGLSIAQLSAMAFGFLSAVGLFQVFRPGKI